MKNFFTLPVTREPRNRFLFDENGTEIRVVPTMFCVQSGYGLRTDYVEFG
jgi:hypothetical protein